MTAPTVTVHGIQLIAHKDRCVEDYQRHGQSTFEPESMQAWREAIEAGLATYPRGVSVVDVGAYSGIYTLVAASLGAYAHAFEPNPDVYQRLKENVRLNRLTELVDAREVACCNDVGTGLLGIPNRPMTSGARLGGQEANRHPVMLYRLDNLVRRSPIVAMKVDVEGNELDVLAGGMKLIAAEKPVIIIECLDSVAKSKALGFLSVIGYRDFLDADGRNLVCRP